MGLAAASFSVLAQHGGHDGGSGQLAYTILLVTILTVIWVLVGVVCWIFWRAKKREDAEKLAREPGSQPPSPEFGTGDWPNAPSS
jgi:uncharacterized iron-regulated membrane protein